MKTTVICSGYKQAWKGSEENWNQHKELIQQWCEGAEIESQYHPHQGWKSLDTPLFDSPSIKYRVKPRTPKPGEVWLTNNATIPVIILMNGNFVSTYTGYLFTPDEVTDMSFAAASTEEYYFSKQDDPLTVFDAEILTEQLQMGYHLLAEGGHDTSSYNSSEDGILSAIETLKESGLA